MRTVVIVECDTQDEAQYFNLLAAVREGLATFPPEKTKIHVAVEEAADLVMDAFIGTKK